MYTITLTKWRLLTRSLSFRMYVGSMVILSIVVVLTALHNNNWMDTLVQIINNLAFFQLPILVWIVTPTIARTNNRTSDWIWVTGVELPFLIMGKIFGLVVGIMGCLFICLTATWSILLFQGALAGPAIFMFWAYALVLLVPITLFELGVILALSLWLRRTILVLLIITSVVALLWLGVLMPTATLFTPLNYTLLTLRLDPLAGFGAEQGILFSLLAFYVLLAVSAVALSIWGLAQLDQRSGWRPGHGWWMSLPLLCGGVGAVATYNLYLSHVRQAVLPSPAVTQLNTWSVLAATYTGDISTSGMTISANLSLLNNSVTTQPSVALMLNPGLKVTRASIENQPVEVQHVGEGVLLSSPTTSIQPGQVVRVELAYSGVPQLAREDYSLVTSLAGNNPASYTLPIRTYLDSDVILLQRDGNWRTWPLQPGPHVAPQSAVTLTIYHNNMPVISSGALIERHEMALTYQWSGALPQFLVASAPYQVQQQMHGTIFIAPLSDPRDIIRTSTALHLRRALSNWLEPKQSSAQYQAVILPYVQDVTLGGDIIGLPPTGRQLVLQDAFAPTSPEAMRRLASAISLAWLNDHISWLPGEMNTTGRVRSESTICTRATATDELKCETHDLGGINRQAPHRRVVEENAVSPLLKAFSVVLGQHLMMESTGGQEQLMHERQLWSQLATMSDELGTSSGGYAFNALTSGGLLDLDTTLIDARAIAQLVVELEQISSTNGDTAFVQLVHDLVVRHPIGGPPLTEQVFQQTVHHSFEKSFPSTAMYK